MRNCRSLFLTAAFAACLSVSCNKAVVQGSFSQKQVPGALTARILDNAGTKVLDTVKVEENGSFKYDFPVQKGEPEFLYLYYGDTKVASLLLAKGDKVSVSCDTLGSWTVDGSEDCSKLLENELALAKLSSQPVITLKNYLAHYRSMLQYVMKNSHSLTVVPVLFQKVGDTPVFSQASDGVLFNSIADSLAAVYPKSRYVKILRDEATARMNLFSFQNKLEQAQEASFLDFTLPDDKGQNIALSSACGKATLLVFWNASDAVHKMYNLEVLKPLYAKYKAAGLEIFAVNAGTDKNTWAMAVREQKLEWTNVCDTRGTALNLYGVSQVPALFLISDNGTERLEKGSMDYLSGKVASALK